MARALVALGSNVGDRARYLTNAVQRLEAAGDVRVLGVSRWSEYRAIGGPEGQPAFLNGAVLLETSVAPQALLARLLRVENELGRQRHVRWGRRTIDLDLLLYDELVCRQPDLEIPHPRMAMRRFVLEPVSEIAGAMLHPTTGWSLDRLLEHLRRAIPYAAITGAPGSGKTELARQVARAVAGRLLSLPPLPAAADHPGSDLPVEIEFVGARRELLARQAWEADQSWSVSDFWLGQSLAYGRTLLEPDVIKHLEERLQAEQQRCVPPKITVLVETPLTEAHGQGTAESAHPTGGENAPRLAAELARAVQQRDLGPVLRLSGLNLAQATLELTGVLEGMR